LAREFRLRAPEPDWEFTMKPVRKAVLPVAGFGTRVLPATKAVPKEMLTVFDRPALQYVVDEAREAGIEHFVFITGRGKQAIEDYFDKAYELEATLEAKKKDAILAEVRAAALPPGASSFTRQQAALGLGHAVLCAREIIGDEPFAVLLPDVIVTTGAGPSVVAQGAEADGVHHHQHPVLAQRHARHVQAESLFQQHDQQQGGHHEVGLVSVDCGQHRSLLSGRGCASPDGTAPRVWVGFGMGGVGGRT
jgi:UTP-glucose-1-phosphate uridylyltransferase